VKAHLILLSFLLFWCSAQGQFVDSFSDGNFDLDPMWTGMSDDFLVENQVLKLNAPAVSSVSYLATSSSAINNASWAFDITLDFNPSANNYLKVYLVADQVDLTNDLQGYYVLIGDTPDEVSLYRQSGTSVTKIIDGQDGRLSLSTVQLSVLVTRDTVGNWLLQSKLSSESNWFTEGSVYNDDVVSTAFFGLVCTYTSTRSTKFAFDNFMVTGDPYVDTKPPEIISATFMDSQTIALQFNESIDSTTATTPGSYTYNQTFNPVAIIWQDTTVLLELNEPPELINSLSVINLNDLAGNPLDTTLQIVYVDGSPTLARELVINELMPDPSPQEDLPDAEYIELLNISDKVINLKGWLVQDLVSTTTLSEYLLFPDSVVIVCATNDLELFSAYGATIGASPWPSLNNTGDLITLENPSGTVIDQVEYTPGWYDDAAKKDGGWSLELIYPGHQCSSADNWSVSINKAGGTPGARNSVYNQTDDTRPALQSFSSHKDSIQIVFSETIRGNDLVVNLEPYPGTIQVRVTGKVLVILPQTQLQESVPYLLYIEGITDCNGNYAEPIELEIVLPDTPQQAAVVINEILFNPRSSGVDFIELYNATAKYYSLAGWIVSNGDQNKLIGNESLILAPYSYLVLTPDPNILAKEYAKGKFENYFKTALPAMNNDAGAVVILSADNIQLDSVYYSEEQHFDLLSSVEGVSLERVSASAASGLDGNWQSAASTEDYATPGYRNSQAYPLKTSGQNFSVSPKVIVPDNNGTDDFTTLFYQFDYSGYIANIDVYNLNGHLIKSIANNESLGYEGFFTWDGTNEQGVVVPMGHYIIVIELFNVNGDKKLIRNKIVVSPAF
jgi:hypothetical protein